MPGTPGGVGRETARLLFLSRDDSSRDNQLPASFKHFQAIPVFHFRSPYRVILCKMTNKRQLDEIEDPKPERTRAMRYNGHAMRKLQAAIDDDPETDLTKQLPPNYSHRLAEIRSPDYVPPSKCRSCRIRNIAPLTTMISQGGVLDKNRPQMMGILGNSCTQPIRSKLFSRYPRPFRSS